MRAFGAAGRNLNPLQTRQIRWCSCKPCRNSLGRSVFHNAETDPRRSAPARHVGLTSQPRWGQHTAGRSREGLADSGEQASMSSPRQGRLQLPFCQPRTS